MKINREKEIYPHVRRWLQKFLKDRYRRSKVEAHDTHNTSIAKFLLGKGLQNYLKEFSAYDIKVDVTGLIISKKTVRLAFVECKMRSITLKDVGQILAYSRVVNPDYSFIISPSGVSTPLGTLLQTFGRYDILGYSKDKRVRIARWNIERREIDSDSLLPPGEFY